MLALCSMFLPSYYAQNYVGIIGSSLMYVHNYYIIKPEFIMLLILPTYVLFFPKIRITQYSSPVIPVLFFDFYFASENDATMYTVADKWLH